MCMEKKTIITVQLDNTIAEKFDMYYVDKDGEKTSIHYHMVFYGCCERTLAMLIEQFAGQFPTWLCPEQVRYYLFLISSTTMVIKF